LLGWFGRPCRIRNDALLAATAGSSRKAADGSTSEPIKEDFCHDLDDPIEFSE
jgi:hypothetical protein